MLTPWLPPGNTAVLDGRGEVFYRHHRHADPSAPTLLLLHGWTASADLQFFTAYEELAADFSFVAIDHRGHGRGMRSAAKFQLEDAADDAAALIEHLGVGPVLRSWAYPSWLRVGLKRMARKQKTLEPYIEWLAGELSRNSAVHLVHAGQALSRYDAVMWAEQLGVPSAMLITTKDHLVKPRKQKALAKALGAHVIEVAGDHLAPWMNAVEFSHATASLARHVAAHRVGTANSARRD